MQRWAHLRKRVPPSAVLRTSRCPAAPHVRDYFERASERGAGARRTGMGGREWAKGEVLEDGPSVPAECYIVDGPCSHAGQSASRQPFQGVVDALEAVTGLDIDGDGQKVGCCACLLYACWSRSAYDA